MLRLVPLLTIGFSQALIVPSNAVRGDEPKAPVRGVLVRSERVTPE